MKEKFNGPLFIVGLSRSGTKLIRDLLNQNDKIYLPNIESHFIPGILQNSNLDVKGAYSEIKKSSFVERFQDIKMPSLNDLNRKFKIDTKTQLIEAVLKYYASPESNSIWNNDVIWGDKTPSYLRHLDLLDNFYPNCKFIHIIRDPRDRALSVKKTWGKSMFRATELWRREILNSKIWKENKLRYFELKYEELIQNPEIILKDICAFLDIDYSDSMLGLAKPSEKYGDNSRLNRVNDKSVAKYTFANPKLIKRIEEIAYPIMQELDYEIQFASMFKPFSSFQMFFIRIIDYINFKINVKRKGY